MPDTNQPGGLPSDDKPIPLTPVPDEQVPTARLAGGRAPEPRAKISKPGLIADFPEDADFDKDPAVEFERKGAAAVVRVRAGDDEPTDGRPEFVRPFIEGLPLGEAKFWAIGACVLLAGAAILVAFNAPTAKAAILGAILSVYNGVLNTGLGVVAVYVAAHLSEQRVGRVELAAGRMFLAVSAFCLVVNIPMKLTQGLSEELALAGLVYAAAVAGLFRVWRRPLVYLLAAHLVLWLIVQVGMSLASQVETAAAAASKAAGAS